MRGSLMCGFCAQNCTATVLTILPGHTPYCCYRCALADFTELLRQGRRRWWDGTTIVKYHPPETSHTVLIEVLQEKKARMQHLQGESDVIQLAQLQRECDVIQRSLNFLDWCDRRSNDARPAHHRHRVA
jgi:hypothetical protein